MQGQFGSGIMGTAGEEGENNNNNKDWINELSDCILSSIVSLLGLKDAMETVPLVCRRWRGLDTMLKRLNLEFDIPNIYGVMDERLLLDDDEICPDLLDDFPREVFIRRVDKVLQLYHDKKKVDSFKVTFNLNAESTATLDEWIRFALTKAVSVLDLHLYLCSFSRYENNDYVFPCHLLSELNASSSLRNLSLTRCVLRPPPGFDGFSQLTSLYLYDIIFEGGASFIERLCFEYCLCLESLTIRDCPLGTEFILHGPSLRLKELRLAECYNLERVDVSLSDLAYIEVMHAIDSMQISIKPLPQLERMSVLMSGGKDNLCRKLTQFASFPGLETLYLQLEGHLEKSQSFATFKYLKKLQLDLYARKGDLLTVLSILKAAPLLEELVLSLCIDKFVGDVSDFDSCGFTHDGLRKVKLQGFRSRPYEIEFAICLLNNTTKLEIMIVDPLGKIYVGAGAWWQIMDLNASYKYNADWEEEGHGRAIVREKLKHVETAARVIIL